MESTRQGGVSCQLSTTVERETVCDDFEPPAVHNVWLTQIQIGFGRFVQQEVVEQPGCVTKFSLLSSEMHWTARLRLTMVES